MDNPEEVWAVAQKLMDMSPVETERAFGIDVLQPGEQDRFWENFPHNISYEEAKKRPKSDM